MARRGVTTRPDQRSDERRCRAPRRRIAGDHLPRAQRPGEQGAHLRRHPRQGDFRRGAARLHAEPRGAQPAPAPDPRSSPSSCRPWTTPISPMWCGRPRRRRSSTATRCRSSRRRAAQGSSMRCRFCKGAAFDGIIVAGRENCTAAGTEATRGPRRRGRRASGAKPGPVRSAA